ncbi:MAG: T9SS type A sorting domain-containing protein [Janthinobacterium lividum]
MKQDLLLSRTLLVVGSLIAACQARAQAPAWQAAISLTAPGTGSAYANAVATDAAGNVYVAGQFSGTLSLGTFSLTSPTSANNGFIAKWNPTTQQFSWARQMGGSVTSAAVAGTSIYATGYFSNTASFGTTTLTTAGDYDVFVVKLLDAGTSNTLSWVRQAGGAGDDQSEAIAASSSAVYVAGRFAQAATFGTTVLTAGTASNGFITKLADGGSTATFTWAQQVASAGPTYASGLAVAGSALYVVGRFEQATTIGTSTLSTTGGALAYIAKLLDAGATSSVSWVQAPTSAATSMYARGVVVSGSNVYVTGDFTGTVAFGAQTLTTAGRRDVFVAKLTDGGSGSTFAWAQAAGGAADDLGPGLAVAGNSVYVAGTFTGTASFGTTTLTSAGNTDIFVTRLVDAGPSATFAWGQRAGGPGNDSSYDMALSGSLPVVVGSFNATANFGAQAITNAALYSENAYLALLSPSVLATSSRVATSAGRLYPNPAYGLVTVALLGGTGPATLTLFDSHGRAVRTQIAAASTEIPVDLAGLAPGVYALRVQTGEITTTQKLVIE